MAPRPIRKTVERVLDLNLEKAWRVFSDTDHFNRFAKLPKVVYGPGPKNEPAFVRGASAVMAGFTLSWVEYPFDWVEGQYFNVTRVYVIGPVVRVLGGIEFESVSDDKTKLRFVAEITPRSWLTSFVASFLAWRTLRGFVAYCEEYLRNVANGEEYRVPARRGGDFYADRLHDALSKVNAVRERKKSIVYKFTRHISEAGDDEVARMRPYALADQWKENRYETLEFFLHATRAGILTLDWQLMCPNCRVPKAEFTTFRTMAPEYHCDLCGIAYETDLEKYTELKFSVSPSIRIAEDAVFCIGSPARMPHVVTQRYLAPGDACDVTVDLQADSYRLRTIGGNISRSIDPHTNGAASLTLCLGESSWGGDGTLKFVPGRVAVKLKNDSARGALVVLERTRWDSQAVTAAEVTTMQEFRDLFSSEVLAPGQRVGVRSLCIMFTDLKKSTELYELVGDAAAFGRVIRHFDFITEYVGSHHGAVVKTIGDAVMAVFPSRLKAVEAAVKMQQDIAAFNVKEKMDPPLSLKIGIHCGPAIAVNANEAFDYFGRTVNLAARIQSESEGDDLVLSDVITNDLEVQIFLRQLGLKCLEYDGHLKGFEQSVRLGRILFSKSASGEKKRA